MSDDHFADFDETSTSHPYSGERQYSQEVFSKKISAKFRTFFVDVKKNDNGHLIKISEKSRGGKKSTVMLDEEDLSAVISALEGARSACDAIRE